MTEVTPRRAVNIGICTYRRSHIADTLRSIAEGNIPTDIDLTVIVADNDIKPTAQDLVTSLTLPFAVKYVHAPAGNISIARNACLSHATAETLIFIDDDELVSPYWLNEILAEQARSGADVVLGPVEAIYPDDAPNWMKRGKFHNSSATFVKGEILTGYSCNALINLVSPAATDLRFKLELGRTGGEDTMFFTELHQRGGKISYAPEALITEAVAPDRASFAWLFKRKIRFGQTHGLVLIARRGNGLAQRLKGIAASIAKIAYCGLRAVLSVFNTARSRYWLLRGALHIGVISKLLGGQEAETYGSQTAPEETTA
ncbi:MAG: glycosyltransferase family 2 protein [Henriciella sp.]